MEKEHETVLKIVNEARRAFSANILRKMQTIADDKNALLQATEIFRTKIWIKLLNFANNSNANSVTFPVEDEGNFSFRSISGEQWRAILVLQKHDVFPTVDNLNVRFTIENETNCVVFSW